MKGMTMELTLNNGVTMPALGLGDFQSAPEQTTAAKDSASAPTSAARPNARFDMSRPANQRKLAIVEELAQLAEQNGLSLIEMAIAFAIHHPGVTAQARRR